MKFKITTTYNYYITPDNEKMFCKFYNLNNIPFTFDEVLDLDPAIIALADISQKYSAEDLFKASNYLVLEEAHPLLFEIELENPELLPAE